MVVTDEERRWMARLESLLEAETGTEWTVIADARVLVGERESLETVATDSAGRSERFVTLVDPDETVRRFARRLRLRSEQSVEIDPELADVLDGDAYLGLVDHYSDD